jgi:hypothetical protein
MLGGGGGFVMNVMLCICLGVSDGIKLRLCNMHVTRGGRS